MTELAYSKVDRIRVRVSMTTTTVSETYQKVHNILFLVS